MENLTPEIIEKLGRAGCIGVNMGVESTNHDVLASMNRKSTYLKNARNVIRLCREHGIQTTCFFIIGLPRDTIARSLRTIRDALSWNPSQATFTVATPYPGTELEVWAKTHDYLLEYSAISEFPKWRKYLISLSFRGQSSVRPVQVGGFDVNIVSNCLALRT